MINSTRIGVSVSRYNIIIRIPSSYMRSIGYMIVDCKRMKKKKKKKNKVGFGFGRGVRKE